MDPLQPSPSHDLACSSTLSCEQTASHCWAGGNCCFGASAVNLGLFAQQLSLLCHSPASPCLFPPQNLLLGC